jgi:hypothetical protein
MDKKKSIKMLIMNNFVPKIFVLFFVLSYNLDAFNVAQSRWVSPEAVISFSDPSGTMACSNAPDLKNGVWIDETKLAFDRWTGIDNVGFDISYDTVDCGSNCSISNGKNEVYWMETGVEPINLPANALAVTMKRYLDNVFVEVDIIINKSFDKDPANSGLCIGGGNCYDYPSIITHEIGHFFGMEHTSEDPGIPYSDPRRQATMYYRLATGGTLLPLKADDKAGMVCMYPASSYGAPYKVPDCCLSYNPFDRAPGCSHSFSAEPDAQSLDSSNLVGGCGQISSISGGGSGGGLTSTAKNSFLYFLILFSIFIFISIIYRNSLIKTSKIILRTKARQVDA